MAFEKQTAGAVEFYTSSLLSGVRHAFSTRLGGVSASPCDSMNLGSSAYDDRDDILENYRIFTNACKIDPASLVFTKQVHADTVFEALPSDRGNGFAFKSRWECDGLFTNGKGLALTVFWADCVPVLLFDPDAGAIAAFHAGWRGTSLDIAGKTVLKMRGLYGCKNITAAIGPSIGPCCFETGEDVAAAMSFAPDEYIESRDGRRYIDLRGINAWQLKRAGVTQTDVSGLCTRCMEREFFSHRRNGAARGTQAAMITL